MLAPNRLVSRTPAAGFYLYKKNQDKVDEFLSQQGIKMPGGSNRDVSSLSLEDLVKEKEHLEDIIAEREMQAETKETEGAEKA